MNHKTFTVLHMSCAACATSVERFLNNQQGVKSASVNFANQQANIEFAENANLNTLKTAVQSIGYDLLLADTLEEKQEIERQKTNTYQKLKRRVIGALFFAVPLFVIGMFFMNIPYANYIMWLLATPIVLYFGQTFFIGAYKQFKNRSANMDTLVAMSTGVAYLFSVFNTIYPHFWHQRGMHAHVYFEAAGIVIAFVLVGKLLEEKAKGSTNSALKKLIGLQPKNVYVITSNNEQIEKSVSEIQKDDVLLVRPGERIAVDGEIIQGDTYIDESSITGEPIPVFKTQGNYVLSGTINQQKTFQLRAQKVGSQTLLAQIIQRVEEAQASKAPIQKTIDKISAVFVPTVIIIAIISGIIWLISAHQYGLERGVLATITVLVIACPCALGLATPTAIMVGVGKAAQMGILIKDAQSIELTKKINSVILDKTGTITQGKPTVTHFQWTVGHSDELQNILYTIERYSEHPLAEAICNYLGNKNTLIDSISVENYKGQGIYGLYKNEKYIVGNLPLMESLGINISAQQREIIGKQMSLAKTTVLFTSQQKVLAIIAIEDSIKPTSGLAIEQLQKMGISVTMLTGDNQQSADIVARTVGIKQYIANTLPTQKAEFVRKQQNEGKIVAMVGDGINDSNALAQAHVSIAMGKGSDIAMEVANMTIVSSDLTKIVQAIQLSKKTTATIRQNLFWAFIYNIIGIPIAAGILYPINGFVLDPMWAGAAMALSSVSVITNSLRLQFSKNTIT